MTDVGLFFEPLVQTILLALQCGVPEKSAERKKKIAEKKKNLQIGNMTSTRSTHHPAPRAAENSPNFKWHGPYIIHANQSDCQALPTANGCWPTEEQLWPV